MNNQSEVTIKISEETALQYQKITEFERQKIEQKLNEIITSELEKIRKKSNDKLTKLMDEISQKAIARGLTPEILEEILNEHE